jgi:hemoglobin
MSTSQPRPAPTGDLEAPADVAEMVRRFYGDVAQDDLLGPMFNDVAHVDWSAHLPKLTAFWCRVLFGTPGYSGNPFQAHSLVHAQRAFTAAHFERWLDLFAETVDEGWFGPNADRVKALAANVASVHGERLLQPSEVEHEAVVAEGLHIRRARGRSLTDRTGRADVVIGDAR